jgi:uncharacterized pyridoxamine 5'-phosphate oxidase family protein
MHLGTTITGVLLVVACVLPLVIANKKRKRKSKQILNDLKSFAAKYNSKISEHEIWSGTAIGIDKEQLKLFFIRANEGGLFEWHVNLASIQKSSVSTTGKSIKSTDGDTHFVERLEMELTFNDGQPRMLLEFYNNNRDNITLSGELQLLEKWVKNINELLDDFKKSKRHF